MATVNHTILKHQKKSDNTWNVKLRITQNRQSAYLSTRHYVSLRERFGRPIIVNSGFRCKDLNRAVGGEATSQHMKGEAADIYAGTKEGNRELFELIRKHLPFDQLINENGFSWVHVSFREGRNRKQTLKLRNG